MPSANQLPSAAAAPAFTVSCDSGRLDVPWIIRSIRGSYWGGSYPDGQIRQALRGSLCFGAYALNGQQIGFVRVVSDGAIFSSICDVFVQEECRGKGVGTALMTTVIAHPSVAGTLCILRARPAAAMWYYKNFDFQLLDPVHGIMQRQPK